MSAARLVALSGLALAASGVAAQSTQSDRLSDYLVDIGPGPVSAADLIGVSAASVTDIQSLKDFNVLLSPGDGSEQKTGMGLQITPGRTQWSPITARQYVDSDWSRFLASISISYAQNQATYVGADYRQQAAALHAAYYFRPADDPIVAAHNSFAGCEAAFGIERQKAKGMLDALAKLKEALGRDPTPEERAKAVVDYNASALFVRLSDEAGAAVKQCVADGAREAWNAPLVTLTLGSARIRPEQGGNSLSLGRSLSLAAVLPGGKEAAINVLARFNRKEVDTDTLAASPTYSDHTLLAARYTYRGGKDSKLFGIAEVSNAKSSDATISGSNFKYALGVDAKVLDAFWLEFRVGRARAVSNGDEETKALLAVKWSSTPGLPTLFTKQ